MTRIAATLVLLAMATGCAGQRSSEPSALPYSNYPSAAACEDAGGRWHTASNSCTFSR
jgi:hypothetical protein